MEPLFISVERASAIHAEMIRAYGGESNLRDHGLLESAVAQAEAGLGDDYLHSFPFGMAAAYAFHLISNHPFVDGNKRTGVATAFLFLAVNGFVLDCSERALESFGLGLATGTLTKPQAEEFLRANSRAVREEKHEEP